MGVKGLKKFTEIGKKKTDLMARNLIKPHLRLLT